MQHTACYLCKAQFVQIVVKVEFCGEHIITYTICFHTFQQAHIGLVMYSSVLSEHLTSRRTHCA